MDLRPESSFLKKPFSELHREGLHRKKIHNFDDGFSGKASASKLPGEVASLESKGRCGLFISYSLCFCLLCHSAFLTIGVRQKRAVKNSMFLQPLKNASGDSGIFNGILIGYALRFVEISVDVAAK